MYSIDDGAVWLVQVNDLGFLGLGNEVIHIDMAR